MPTAVSRINLQYDHTIGRGEQFGPGFTYPYYPQRGPENLLYVINRGAEYRPEGTRISILTVDDEEYVSTFARGVQSQGPHEFNYSDGSLVWPTGMAFDSNWNVYVTDECTNRVSFYTKDGDYIGKWNEKPGLGADNLDRPAGIAINKADNSVYVTDPTNHRIQKRTTDGRILAQWGSYGHGAGELDMPWGIAVDRQGNVYVADWRNDRIQKFSADGKFLLQFGRSGTGEGEFSRPSGVAVDKDGVIYVSDWMNNRLQVFDADGSFVTLRTGDATISKWGVDKLNANPEMWEERKRAWGLEREKDFWGPTGICVDDDCRVYICETARNRVQIYQKQAPVFIGPRL